MSEFISMESALKAIQEEREEAWIESPFNTDMDDGFAYAMKAISELPTVDAVEVIRCKDCKFFVSDMEWCEADDEHPTSPDAFCAWAERRSDE